MTSELETVQVTKNDEAFLKALYDDYDGRASITDLRETAGLSRGEANHQFEKWSDHGVIAVEYEPFNRTQERRVATLTDTGRTSLATGDLLGDPSKTEEERAFGDAELSELRELEERVEELENKVNALSEKNRVQANRIDDLVEAVRDIDIKLNGLRWALEDSSLMLSIEEYVAKVRENSE